MESNWKDGLQHGSTTGWHANGQIKEKSNWVNGEQNGTGEGWYANGQKEFENRLKTGKRKVYKLIGTKMERRCRSPIGRMVYSTV